MCLKRTHLLFVQFNSIFCIHLVVYRRNRLSYEGATTTDHEQTDREPTAWFAVS